MTGNKNFYKVSNIFVNISSLLTGFNINLKVTPLMSARKLLYTVYSQKDSTHQHHSPATDFPTNGLIEFSTPLQVLFEMEISEVTTHFK